MLDFKILATALVLAAPAAQATTVIDFAPLGENTAVTDQFLADGVTFRGIEDGADVPIVVANFASDTGDSYLSNCYPIRCSQRADILEISFLSAASNVSFVLDTEGIEEVTFNAYDSGGGLLETFSASSDGGTFSFVTGGIFRIDALQPSESWGWGLAKLSFDTTAPPVPLPASLPLLVAGMAGLGVLRRRKRAAR